LLESGDRELRNATSGEEVAIAVTPEEAHRALLDRSRRGFRFSPAHVLILVLMTAAVACALSGAPRSEVALVWGLAFVAIPLAGDIRRSTNLLLLYDFEPGQASQTHQRMLDVFQETMKSSRKEFVREGPRKDGFRPISGAAVTSNVSHQAPGIETNVAMPVLRSESRSIYLLPDCVLAFDDGERTPELIPYRDLIVEFGQSPVVEASPPDDAAVLYRANGSGGMSVAVYDWIRLATPAHDIALIQLSRPGTAVAFAEALEGAGAKLSRA